jgi:GTP-binding protein
MLMQSIRNVAIIAHVDHGKTTLVDNIIKECKVLDRKDAGKELILDNNDLEKERGITILSKNVSVLYKDIKINLIDTPGHSDFGGEVERVLKMADGVLLLVDAFEGPMPQTRFVLGKAVELGLKPIVVINKVDKENCQPENVQQDVFDLMYNLNASEEQLDFQTIYGSAKFGWMNTDWKNQNDNILPLLDIIVDEIPEAPYYKGIPQMQIASLDYSNYVGRIAIGRVFKGEIEQEKQYAICKRDGSISKIKIKELFVFEGLGRKKTEMVRCGDICAVVGLDEFDIGDTITDFENPEPLPRIKIDEPTISMLFLINNSPFFGKEGKYVTSRQLRERLMKETEKNLALRVSETNSEDRFIVSGRGVLHLSVLIETIRREGYELQVGKPQVIMKEIDGKKHEPFESLVIDAPENYSGKIIEQVTRRKGEMLVMEQRGDIIHLEFNMPTRGLFGLRNQVLTISAGEATMSHRFSNYELFKDDMPDRLTGSLIALEAGQTTGYAIDKLQDRGRFFIDPGEKVYKGQVVGEHTRGNDLEVNVTKGKKLTNMRASGSDDNVKIAPKIVFSLEEAMEYIREDEYLEITPLSLRMRKAGA